MIDVRIAVVDIEGGTVPNVGMNVIERDTEVFVHVPVKACRQIAFLSALDLTAVQVQIGIAEGQFPCTQTGSAKPEIIPGADFSKDALLEIVEAMFAREKIAAIYIPAPKVRVLRRGGIHECVDVFGLKR